MSGSGAATVQRVAQIDHVLAAGGNSVTGPVIPDKAVVFGVTGRVTTAITGASGWSLGVPGAIDRYGTGYGTALGAFAHGVTGQPQTYYGGTAIEVTAEGGAFTGGAVRLAVHEVFGHAVAAANGRDQPIRLFTLGSAGSFSDQEGLCLALEERAGLLDTYRLRVLAARVCMTERMHAGAAFSESARWLRREHGFSAEDAIALAERAYRSSDRRVRISSENSPPEIT